MQTGSIQDQAYAKLEAAIQRTLAQTTTAIEKVQRDVPKDAIVKAAGLKFAHDRQGLRMAAPMGHEWGLHRHALGQIAGQAGIPYDYVDTLTTGKDWQKKLLEDVLDTTFKHSQDRHLVRAVTTDKGLEARGFLSDRFRRIDSRPLLDTFIEEVQKVGAKPYGGTATDIRVSLKALLPTPWVFEVPEGAMRADHRGHGGLEAIALGVEWRNGDFGSSANNLAIFALRLWCFNGAVLEDAMKQIHLGRRLEDDITYSDKTYALDTKASISAMRDVIRGLLSPAKVQGTVEKIEALAQQVVSWDKVKAQFGKVLTKDELRRVDEAYNGPDVVNLPPGDTAWRASNALSWIANSTDNAERRLELEKLAGTVLKKAA